MQNKLVKLIVKRIFWLGFFPSINLIGHYQINFFFLNASFYLWILIFIHNIRHSL